MQRRVPEGGCVPGSPETSTIKATNFGSFLVSYMSPGPQPGAAAGRSPASRVVVAQVPKSMLGGNEAVNYASVANHLRHFTTCEIPEGLASGVAR
jgi:hypothetical protein